jgi:hypothetical protein
MLVLTGVAALGIIVGFVATEIAAQLMKQETQARHSALEETNPTPAEASQPERPLSWRARLVRWMRGR